MNKQKNGRLLLHMVSCFKSKHFVHSQVSQLVNYYQNIFIQALFLYKIWQRSKQI